jgi:hypothetical protein
MSSASSPVRRAAAAPNVVSAQAHSPARSAGPSGTIPSGMSRADIPPLDTNLDIEGLEPSLLSRLLDLFSRKR